MKFSLSHKNDKGMMAKAHFMSAITTVGGNVGVMLEQEMLILEHIEYLKVRQNPLEIFTAEWVHGTDGLKEEPSKRNL